MLNDQREFAVALYRWVLEQWAAEIERDFPLIRAVHNHFSDITVEFLEALPLGGRLKTGHLLAKRANVEAAEILGEPLNGEEKSALELWDKQLWRAYDRRDVWSEMEANRKINRLVLRKCVREAIEPVLGADRGACGPVRVYRTRAGRSTVVTGIEFGHRNFAISYDHSVLIGESEDARCIAKNVSVPGRLGACSGRWSGLSDQDIPKATAGLAFLCRHFLEAVSRLLPK